jgi:AhpD family alkylhydroperoxidase
MARIAGVSARDAGLGVKLASYFTRRQLKQLTGRETERMTEPVEMYAHAPGVLSAYGKLEQATAKLHRVDGRLKVLAELKAATLTNCEYCIDLGSQVARRSGLTDEQLLALPHYRESGLSTVLDPLGQFLYARAWSSPSDGHASILGAFVSIAADPDPG